MAFNSQLFWIAIFMQHLQGLTPLDVAVRLLPQALVGLIISPLVGLIMHRIKGTALLAVGALALLVSNILLIFVRDASDYFVWVFPSLILSTLGMDWIVNVGSVSSFHQRRSGARREIVGEHKLLTRFPASRPFRTPLKPPLYRGVAPPVHNAPLGSHRHGGDHSGLVLIHGQGGARLPGNAVHLHVWNDHSVRGLRATPRPLHTHRYTGRRSGKRSLLALYPRSLVGRPEG